METKSYYETVTILFPAYDKAIVETMEREEKLLTSEEQKYFFGPLLTPDNLLFYSIICHNNNLDSTFKNVISRITQTARKICKEVSLVRIAFGGPNRTTRVLETSDSRIVTDEDGNTRMKMSLLEGTNKILIKQLQDLQKLQDRDTVLSEGIRDLQYLKHHKDLLTTIKEAGQELRSNNKLSDQSSQRLLQLLQEMEKKETKT
jgi:hypothetical protein